MTFGEILIFLYGCRPEKIGWRKVKKLSLDKTIAVCRLEPWEHFDHQAEQAEYCLTQTSAYAWVDELLERGLMMVSETEKLLCKSGGPSGKVIESCGMIRLTEEGKKFWQKSGITAGMH